MHLGRNPTFFETQLASAAWGGLPPHPPHYATVCAAIVLTTTDSSLFVL